MTLAIGRVRIDLAVIATAIGVVLLASPIDQAEAAHDAKGRIGTYVFKHSSCEPNGQINAHAPMMYAAWGGGRQWAAFRTQLQQWNGYAYQRVALAPWKVALVDHYGYAYQWFAGDFRTPVYANHRFTVPNQGTAGAPVYYRLVTQFYWYPDATRPAGSVSDVNPVHDNRPGAGLTQKTYDYCKFPGANELTIIG